MTAWDLDNAIDLPAIDLGAPDGRGGIALSPAGDRRSFEERYAQLAFGLGTVPRRVRPDDAWWETAPGVLAIVATVIALLLLAG